MGDRTVVTVTYPKWADPIVREIIEQFRYGAEGEYHSDTLVCITDDECNYGEHPLEQDLKRMKIPYDTRWQAGSEYGPGSKRVRYRKGKIEESSIADEELADIALKAIEEFKVKGKAAALKVIERAAAYKFFNVKDIASCGCPKSK